MKALAVIIILEGEVEDGGWGIVVVVVADNEDDVKEGSTEGEVRM